MVKLQPELFGIFCCHPINLVRIWDTNHILQKTVVRPTTPTAARVGVTTCGYNSDGKLLAAGMLDGAIQVIRVAVHGRGGGRKKGSAVQNWVHGLPTLLLGKPGQKKHTLRRMWELVISSVEQLLGLSNCIAASSARC